MNRPSKDRFFGDRCYFIYDRPTFAVNLQRFDRGRVACSSRACISNLRRYDWTHVARVIPQNSRGTDRWRWHADPAIFDLSKCIRLCYPEGYIYPLPIQANGLGRDRAPCRSVFRGRSRTSEQRTRLLLFLCLETLLLRALLFLSACERKRRTEIQAWETILCCGKIAAFNRILYKYLSYIYIFQRYVIYYYIKSDIYLAFIS